ncbi:MAG: hypothetical protein ACYC4L_17020 [Chloroflexota bacterium]
MKWISLLLALTVLVALVAFAGPTAGELLFGPIATQRPTAIQARATASPSAALVPAPSVPTATVTATATVAPATPTPRPSVPAAAAETLVRDFFAAVGAKDYARLQDLTGGQARQVADGIIAEVARNEQESGVTLQPRLRRLDVLGTEPREGGAAVRVGYDIEILAQVGPFAVPSRELTGEAVFTVEEAEGRLFISTIEGDLAY